MGGWLLLRAPSRPGPQTSCSFAGPSTVRSLPTQWTTPRGAGTSDPAPSRNGSDSPGRLYKDRWPLQTGLYSLYQGALRLGIRSPVRATGRIRCNIAASDSYPLLSSYQRSLRCDSCPRSFYSPILLTAWGGGGLTRRTDICHGVDVCYISPTGLQSLNQVPTQLGKAFRGSHAFDLAGTALQFTRLDYPKSTPRTVGMWIAAPRPHLTRRGSSASPGPSSRRTLRPATGDFGKGNGRRLPSNNSYAAESRSQDTLERLQRPSGPETLGRVSRTHSVVLRRSGPALDHFQASRKRPSPRWVWILRGPTGLSLPAVRRRRPLMPGCVL